MQYKLVTANDPESLEAEVSRLSLAGWRLYGNPVVSTTTVEDDDFFLFAQAVTDE